MTRLSNRQYPMLKAMTELPPGKFLSIDGAKTFDQRPFRSMLIQGWVAYSPGHGFHCTRKGREAMREFLMTDIARKDPSMPLTAYFDPTAYGLKLERTPRRRSEPKTNTRSKTTGLPVRYRDAPIETRLWP